MTVRAFAGGLQPVVAIAVALAASLLAPAAAQETPPPSGSTFAVEASRVVVDVIVRDGTRPVVDLRSTDFDVLEDGVPQAIEQFAVRKRPAAGAEAPRGGSPPTRQPADATSVAVDVTAPPPESPDSAVLALVFDGSSGEGWARAQKAASEFLAMWRKPGDYVGLFVVLGGLTVAQTFTTDTDLLEAAVARLGHIAPATTLSYAEDLRERASLRASLNTGILAAARVGGAAGAKASAMARALAIQQSMEDVYRSLQRDQRGFATAHALTAVVDGMRVLPGRKGVVLFAEALFRTEATEKLFQSVVHSANRANVAVYAIDVSGLQVHSLESAMKDELETTQAMNNYLQESGSDVGGGAMIRSLERAGDMVRFNPQAGLEWLARGTGGFVVRDTNDLGDAMRRVDADLRFYYLLGYTPTNQHYDGRFRKISVRVRRGRVQVRARSGYFAVRSTGPVLAHVAPALAILENGERPHAFELATGAVPFAVDAGVARVTLAAAVPCAPLVRLAAREKVRGGLDLTVLSRVLAADGKAVDAVSRRFTVPLAREQPKGAAWRLLRDVWLPPGRYRLETVAYDAVTGRAAVAHAAFEVPVAARSLDRAQLVLVVEVGRADPEAPDLTPGHPLRYGEVVLHPALGEPPALNRTRPLVFSVTAPRDELDHAPAATVELWTSGRRRSTASVDWQDANGSYRSVAELAWPHDTHGSMELRVQFAGDAARTLRVPFVVSE
jgi:VWFA-related protein